MCDWQLASRYFCSRTGISSLFITICFLSVIILGSCSVSKSSFTPSKKYSPEQLDKDYAIFRGALEESMREFIGTRQKMKWIIILNGAKIK